MRSRQGILNVEGHARIELTRVTQVAANGAMRKWVALAHADVHVDRGVRFVTGSKQHTGGIAHHPITSVGARVGLCGQSDRDINGLSGRYITGQADGGVVSHLVAAIEGEGVVRCPGTSAAVFDAPSLDAGFIGLQVSPIRNW